MKHQQQKPELVKPELSLERERGADFRLIYSNNAQVITAYFDVSILFGEVLEANQTRVSIRDQVLIRMSPEHAKSLNRLLTEQIAQYEERFGSIRPEPMLAAVKAKTE
jgi:hypothetical protein